MNILVRADSSSSIGVGHIMRDLVLSRQFKDDTIVFATQNLDGNINHIIKNDGYKIYNLTSNDVNEVIAIIKKRCIDMIVIDHYQINYTYEKKLKDATGVQVLVLDDTYEKHYCDILLNHNISAIASRYKNLVPEKCDIRCGEDFTLIRDEFIHEKKNQYINIFISMGGVDHTNILINILDILSEFNGIKAHIVVIDSNNHLDDIKQFAQDREWVKLHINSKKIAKLMRKCDFAIITPSVIVHEVRYMKLPFISIKTAENQEDMHKYLKAKNFLCLKKLDEKKLQKAVMQIIDNIKNLGNAE